MWSERAGQISGVQVGHSDMGALLAAIGGTTLVLLTKRNLFNMCALRCLLCTQYVSEQTEKTMLLRHSKHFFLPHFSDSVWLSTSLFPFSK